MFDSKSVLKERISRNQVIDEYSFKQKFYHILDKQVKKCYDQNNLKLLRSFKKLADNFDLNEQEKDANLKIDVRSSFDEHLKRIKKEQLITTQLNKVNETQSLHELVSATNKVDSMDSTKNYEIF
jgi:hypothetical protein